MTKKISLLFLLIVFTFLYLLPLAMRPLFVPDETRYAEVPREMITTGDWVVPRINGLRYFEKPVMGYWLSAVSLKAFGENNFAVRFPSALSTGITALLIFFVCTVVFGTQSVLPGLTTFVYISTLGVNAIGSFAVLDPPLTMFLTASLVSFFLSTEEKPGSSKERIFLLTAGGLAGCAFLTKGFLAFAVPVLTAGPYLLFQKRWTDIVRMLWLPIVGAVLVSLPWSVLIHMREPDFWNYFFWNEHVRRFLSDTAQHKEPFWYFVAVFPGMFAPWVFFLPPVVMESWKQDWIDNVERRFFLYCLCWFSFPFLFFSASSGKLMTYILPCFPPLAIIFGHGLNSLLRNGRNKGVQIGIGATVLILVIVFTFSLASYYLYKPEQFELFQDIWKWFLLLFGFVLMLALMQWSVLSKDNRIKIILFTFAFSQLFLIARFTMPTLTLSVKAPGDLILRNAPAVTSETYVLSGEELARAVSWYLKREDIYLVEWAGELQYGLGYKDSQHRLLTPQSTGQFVKKHSGNAVLVARYKEYERWLPYLPKPVSIDSSGDKGFLFIRF